MSSNLNYHICELDGQFIQAILPRESIISFIGFILALLYIRLLYVLLTREHLFSNTFYNFLILNGFASLICYISHWNLYKLPIVLYFFGDTKILTEPSWLLSLNCFLVESSAITIFIGILFTSLNRCSMIMNLPNAEYYWNRWAFKFCLFSCIFPMIQNVNMLISKTKVVSNCYPDAPYLNRLSAHIDFYFDNSFERYARGITLFVLDIIILPGCLIANILSVRTLRNRRRESVHAQKTADKFSSSLLRICSVELVIQVICTIIDIIHFFYLYYGRNSFYITGIRVYADSMLELTNISSCLAIILCSATIRKEVFSIKFCFNRVYDSTVN